MPSGNSQYPRRPAPKYGTWPAGDPRRRQLRKPYDGGPVLPLPIVTTVGLNVITNTSVNVVGSVNPNGSDTIWWIAWDTVLPLAPGHATAVTDVGSGTTPSSFTFLLTGLAPSTTYYVAVVGQSGAGTVYGQTLSFTTLATVNPTPSGPVPGVVFPFGEVAVALPHFAWPFTITTTGAKVADQDTLEEISSDVSAIIACTIGQCPQLPFFGRPDLTFNQEPVDTTELVAAIQELEPRATEDAISELKLDGTWAIILQTSLAQGGEAL